GRPGDRPRGRRVHPHARRRPPLHQPRRAGEAAVGARAPAAADAAPQPGGAQARGLRPRRHRGPRLRPAPGDQGADRRLMPVTIVAAVARNRVIGRDNDLPWRIPEDLRRFKELTMGGVLVMGRKTYESIGRPLPGRRTVVVSRNPDLEIEGVEMAPSLEMALEIAGGDDVFVVGGGEIYRQA